MHDNGSAMRLWSLTLGLGGAAAGAIGASMTWVEYRVDLFPGPKIARSGLDYPSDSVHVGGICIALAAIAAALLCLSQIRGLRGVALLPLLGGGLIGLIAVAFRVEVDNDPQALLGLPDPLGVVHQGSGTIVVIFGGVGVALGALVTLATPRPSTARVASAAPTMQRGRNRTGIPLPDMRPNWLPDPARRFEYRFWSGSAWTSRVSANGQEHTDPI